MSQPKDKCAACQKSSLSLLLLRPSPLANETALQPAGASSTQTNLEWVSRFVPAAPQGSRPVLRLLRAGYVHMYIPSTELWITHSVTEQGDLVAQGHADFGKSTLEKCQERHHDVPGYKLLKLPQAHELVGKSIWLAFSANLWSDKLKEQNKENPKAMVQVTIGAPSGSSFKPDDATLKKHLLECNATRWKLSDPLEKLKPMYPMHGIPQAERIQLVNRLKSAAEGHKKTTGLELAVVLPDPVGYAAELNALRIARHELAKWDTAKRHAHPVTSLQMLDGLRQSVIDEYEGKGWDKVSPVMSEGAFKDIMRVKPNPRGWPAGTKWERIVPERGQPVLAPGMGRVTFPDQASRARQWESEAAARNWERYRKYIDEDAIQKWKDQFDKDMLTLHGEQLKRYENDWWAARRHFAVDQYFAQHFDDQAPNKAGTAQKHCAGTVYATEVASCMTPQPLLKGDTLNAYIRELDKPATDKSALMQRAIAGNQGTVLSALAAYVETGRPDKLHDIGAGLLKGADEATILGRHHIQYSWLLHAAYGLNTLAISQSLSAAVAAPLAALGGKGASGSDATLKILERSLMGTKGILLTRESAAIGTLRQVPVKFTAMVPLKDALDEHARIVSSGQTPKETEAQIKARAHQNGTVRMNVVSTNLAMKEAKGVIPAALAAKVAQIDLLATTSAVPVVHLTRKEFTALIEFQHTIWKKSAAFMSEVARGSVGASLSLDGHIGLVSLLLNGLSVYKAASDPATNWSDWDTRFAVLDSSAGTFGGLATVVQSAISASVAYRVGEEAAKASLWVMGAGVLASGAGAFGGLATAAGQAVKATRSLSGGKKDEFALYALSGISFLGQFSTGSIQFVGAFSDFMIARGSQRTLWTTGSELAKAATRRLALRTGGRMVAGALVGGIGLTGFGLIFLACGVIFEVGVVMLTPNALQRHVQNSYFGKDGDAKDKYKTLAEEEQGIRTLTNPNPAKPQVEISDEPYSDPMTGFMVPH